MPRCLNRMREKASTRIMVNASSRVSASCSRPATFFLGWTRGKNGRDFYVRQLRDMKISAIVEGWDVDMLRAYGRICGWALARAHARSGNPTAISKYLGGSDKFDRSIADFAEAYADQNEKDYREFVRAVRKRRLHAIVE